MIGLSNRVLNALAGVAVCILLMSIIALIVTLIVALAKINPALGVIAGIALAFSAWKGWSA